MRKLVIGLLIALASISVGHAQDVGITGLQLLADNAATASAAAELAPLAAAPVTGSANTLGLPQGFSATQVASGLKSPRFMAFDANGNLLVADAGAGSVYRYPVLERVDRHLRRPAVGAHLGPQRAVQRRSVRRLLCTSARPRAISRYAYDPDGGVGTRQVVVPDLPRGGHSTRTIAFGPDGMMYVGIGSSCNICDESDSRRAAVSRSAPDGSGFQRFAYGTRNPVGLAFQPGSGLLWATVNERDNQGNEIPPDLVTILSRGPEFRLAGLPATPRGAADSRRGLLRHHPAHYRHSGAQRAAGAGLLHRPAVPGRLRQRSLCRRSTVPGIAHRRPNRSSSACTSTAVSRSARIGFRDRLAAGGRLALGSPGGRRRRSRRQPDRLRRPGRQAAAHRLYRLDPTSVAAGRPASVAP